MCCPQGSIPAVLPSSWGVCPLQLEPSLASPGGFSPAPGPDQVPIPGSPTLPW